MRHVDAEAPATALPRLLMVLLTMQLRCMALRHLMLRTFVSFNMASRDPVNYCKMVSTVLRLNVHLFKGQSAHGFPRWRLREIQEP